MGSLLAPAKCGIIFIGILIGQVGRDPFLVPLLRPGLKSHNFWSLYSSFPGCHFPGTTRVMYTSLWRSHYLGSGWKAEPLVSGGSRHPRASNPLSEGGVSGKFTDPTKSSNPGTAIWKGTTCCPCTGVSIRQTLT